MPYAVSLSVRALVEYAFLEGSIDNGFRSASALTDGTKAHQSIQKQYGELDRKEVYLRSEIPAGDLLFVVEGRCDGLLVGENGEITIDEIKSSSREIGSMTESDAPRVHWAQAYMYAYMYALESGIERLRVRLTYVRIDSEEQVRFEREVNAEELASFVAETVEKYAPYARMRLKNKLARDESIGSLAFPFPAYREGQKKLVGAVYKAIDEQRKLFAKAPTGIGKTISTLFPAIKALGLGKLEHLFYLTARTITRTAAEDALSLMRDRGLRLSSVTITAKEKICFQEKVDCRKETCPYADGYYDRINGAVLDLLSNETLITRAVVEAYARKHTVCPFEFALDAAYGADAVICDYNYVFDPRVSLKRLSGEHKQGCALLVDEAHNLIDRAREMYSAELDKRTFLELEREFKGVRTDVHASARAINKRFIELKKQSDGQPIVTRDAPSELMELVEHFAAQAEKVLAGGGAGGESTNLLEAYFAALSFLRIGKLYDERYVTYAETDRNDVRLRMFCLDPSHLLKTMGKGYRSHVFFSATLSPLSYYMDMLGAEEEDYSVTLGSPFRKEQWEVTIAPISTRYADRDATQEPLVKLLRGFVEGRPGNYLIFFPSYAYMNGVYERFMAEISPSGTATIIQTPDMREEERESFLAAFEAGNEGTLIGFAVMGGIFSEGIDLVGDRLGGVAIVGVGMPQLGLERNLIKNHFDVDGRNGFDYAYVFPGMNKVLQSGGRLIRSERDRGKLLLVDDRYLRPPYSRLLPEEWRS
ncbi:ATP-dependent DNA helicase [Cohnella endophytica]|uniref:ATP-dependent DNA helicase n=1 Tax=Cohnella endophytica TaxID=2419778 RepID=A0A494XUA3_9BACL|nr:helicase C-terminal domain-containing protein [Cohnella endophytica]RKP51694.1 ATP-dependent DNA helicase [Cohnella endophytica]